MININIAKKATSAVILASIPFLSLASGVFASPVEKTEGFVCPVIKTENVLNSPKGGAISGGFYTIGGPDLSVPTHATNADGAGSPSGTHSSPGDTDYTAIWSL